MTHLLMLAVVLAHMYHLVGVVYSEVMDG